MMAQCVGDGRDADGVERWERGGGNGEVGTGGWGKKEGMLCVDVDDGM